ncbi:hypothetical protein BsWGS_05419 [Bradybaena similaris]
MNVNNFLSKLKQQLMSFQRSNSVSEENHTRESTLNSATEGQDFDDDDYLLVCVPAKKANIESVSHSEIIQNQLNLLNGNCSTVSDSPECHSNEILLHNPTSVVLDIPYMLHPVLDAQLQARAMFDHISLEPCAFNSKKYSHDFTSEKLCLRDMNCGEMANIDEFLLLQEESQAPTHMPSRNSETNLIQF